MLPGAWTKGGLIIHQAVRGRETRRQEKQAVSFLEKTCKGAAAYAKGNKGLGTQVAQG